MTNAPEGAFKIPNFIDQLEPAKFGELTLVTVVGSSCMALIVTDAIAVITVRAIKNKFAFVIAHPSCRIILVSTVFMFLYLIVI